MYGPLSPGHDERIRTRTETARVATCGPWGHTRRGPDGAPGTCDGLTRRAGSR